MCTCGWWVSAEPQRVAVGRGTHDGLSTDIAAATRTVVDNEWLAQSFRQPLAYEPGEDIGPAASGERHDQTHQP
jgi:hypothetical protein